MGLATFELGQVGLGPEAILVARLGLDEDHELQGPMTKGTWSFSESGYIWAGPSELGHQRSTCCKGGPGPGLGKIWAKWAWAPK